MEFDIKKMVESKRRIRRQLQALPIEEKLRILERLREELILGLAKQRAEYKEELRQRRLRSPSNTAG